MRRKRQRQLRIEQRQLRIEIGAVHPFLLLELLPDEDGGEGHFASRSGGGRNHDLRQTRTGDPVESEVIFGLSPVRRQHRDRLGQVHRAAAADADDAVAFLPEGQFRPLVRQFQRRFRHRLVVKNMPDIRLLQRGGRLFAEARRRQIPVEDDQRPADLQLRQVLRQSRETAVSENDFFGARKRKCLHVRFSVSDGTFFEAPCIREAFEKSRASAQRALCPEPDVQRRYIRTPGRKVKKICAVCGRRTTRSAGRFPGES